jgi:protein-disulfide isomerase
MREIWFGALVALMFAGVHPAAAQAPKPDGNPPNAPASAATIASLLAPTGQDRVLGKSDAPITIVEYASLSCPHCAHFTTGVLPKLKEKWIDTGKVKLILRDFPLDEPALRAEMLARCVPPERFYPLVETMFETQEKWVVAKDWRGALEKLVRLAGIGKTEFDSCLGNKAIEDQVTLSRLTAAQQLGVNSTPTFFINGKKYEGEPSVEAFDQLLSGLAAKS